MAIVRTDDTHYKNIANAVRAITGEDESIAKFKPSQLPDQVNNVFSIGKYQGRLEGEEIGEATGRQKVIDENLIIPGTIYGDGWTTLSDISEFSHSVQVNNYTGTEQMTVCGANLCKPNSTNTLTQNGVTITRNADGSITVNGTSTDNMYLYLYENIPAKVGQTFYAHCSFENISDSPYITLQVRNGTTNLDSKNIRETEVTYTVKHSDTNNVAFCYYIATGWSYNNGIIKPFVSLVPDCEYEDYKEQVITFDEHGNSTSDLTSYYPVMTFKADSGTTFDVNYYKSRGKYELNNARWANVPESSTTWNDYTSIFTGKTNNDKTFIPVKNLKPGGASCSGMFTYSHIRDLAGILKKYDRKIDFSQLTIVNGIWQNAEIVHCPELDLSNCTTLTSIFMGCSNLQTVEKIIVSNKLVTNTSGYSFNTSDMPLREIRFEGEWVADLFYFGSKVLSKESIESITNVMSDNVRGMTCKLSLTAVNKAFETSEGAADGSTSDEWETLVASKVNWTITLV